jgi:uncharacterized membrane protein
MIVLETLARRWYAFAFVAALLASAWPEGGWRRAIRFLIVASVVSFLAEYASTHTPLPYGRYDYIAPTRTKELYLAGVPLFVPVAFGSVVWAGRACALSAARTRAGLALCAGAFASAIDLVVDPMTLRGSHWFLGELYRYHAGGVWFGIPWSNFAGWVLVSAIIVAVDDALGASRAAATKQLGRMIAAAICLLFIGIAIATRFWAIAAASAIVTFAIGVATHALPARRRVAA